MQVAAEQRADLVQDAAEQWADPGLSAGGTPRLRKDQRLVQVVAYPNLVKDVGEEIVEPGFAQDSAEQCVGMAPGSGQCKKAEKQKAAAKQLEVQNLAKVAAHLYGLPYLTQGAALDAVQVVAKAPAALTRLVADGPSYDLPHGLQNGDQRRVEKFYRE